MKTFIFLFLLVLASCASTADQNSLSLKEGYRINLSESKLVLCPDESKIVKLLISRKSFLEGTAIALKAQSNIPTGLAVNISPNPATGDTVNIEFKSSPGLVLENYNLIISTSSGHGIPQKGIIISLTSQTSQTTSTN